MNVEQRVLTALRCEEPDRVPVFLFLNPYGNAWCTSEPSYAELLCVCEGLADVVYDSGYPFGPCFMPPEVPIEARDAGNGVVEHVIHTPAGPLRQLSRADWRGRGAITRWINTVEDARRVLSMPYTALTPDLTTFRAECARLGDRVVGQLTFPDPICIAGWIDEQTMALWTLEERGLLRELLDMAFERIQAALRHCLEAGAGPIYYFNGPEFALPPLMSPADFEEFVVAYDSRLVELIHSYPGRYVIVHSHGRVSRFLERFAAIGVDGLNVLEPPPMGDTVLADAKRRIGGQVCLIGNVQYDDIARGSEADVQRLVRQAIREAAPGGGFILCPCAAPYERPLPENAARNLIQFLRAGRRWGEYPLR